MGRPPSHGGPAFRFNPAEVAEMETILHEHNTQVPTREVLQALADKFSLTPERSGKIEVQMKQVWNWFQNRRYAIRAKANKSPAKLHVSSTPREDSTAGRSVLQVPHPVHVAAGGIATLQSAGRTQPDSTQMEFEAKSARDGAWYDVTSFLSHKSLETGDPEVLVRFAGFGPEEDEWVNVRKHVRQRSLPCESAECVAVLPTDLILCFQEGKEQALYFDAHVLDAQRRRHDMRGCRCRFLVRYDHDQSEEIVPLKKICRRPETDHRLQQLHAGKEPGSVNQQTTGLDPHSGNTLRVYPPSEPMQKLQTTEERAGAAAARLPTTHATATTGSKVPQPQNIDFRSGGSAESQVSQPKSTEPSSADKLETVVVPPSNVPVPSAAAAAATGTVAASNAETSEAPQASADPNVAATANAESSAASLEANSVGPAASTVPTISAETSAATQDNSAMDIDATTSTVDTTVEDTSMAPPVNAAADTGATQSTAPIGNAETSVAPSADSAMNGDATTGAVDTAIAEASADPPPVNSAATTSTVDTASAETLVTPPASSAVDVGAAGTGSDAPGMVEPSAAPPTNVEVPSGDDTTAAAAAATCSDQNVLQGEE